ncbi:phage tail tape measure protein [Actinocrispum wychmicini]|uniref:Phage-related minor tail protein n=1 Tax=Actinocrispum wychmicini TaxID=1213861 RepID=A0A4R2K550_9PSEU|nr:phage tail tape measure protein [Actinocrispum wychmicini]TCO64956.1 phage-related minor tail protein [Actinocrispum wychmicini]
MANKNTATLVLAGDEKKLTDAMDRVGSATKRMTDQVDKSSSDMERLTGQSTEKSAKSYTGFIGKIGEVGLAIQGLSTVGDVLGNIIGGQDIAGKLGAQLGTTTEEAGKLGGLAGKIYADNFGESLDDVGAAVSQVVRNIGGMDQLGADGLKQVSESALALRDTFDIDVTESTNAVGHLLKTGLVKDAQQGMDLVAVAFQKIPNAAEDATDTLSEYSVQFQKLGLDGPHALGLIAQGMQAGARNTDVLADALKEFSIRAVDGSATSIDGFKQLGLNATTTAEMIARGGDSASQGLNLVLEKLRGIKDPVKQGQIAVELFGTKAEDLGKALYALDPSKATQALGSFEGAAKRTGDSLSSGPTAKIEAAKRAFEGWATDTIANVVIPVVSGFVDLLNATLVPALSSVVGWVKENWSWLSIVLAVIAAMAAPIVAVQVAMAAWEAATKLVTIAQTALNAVMDANPILLIISVLAGLVAAFVMLWEKSAGFRQFWIDLWEQVQNVVGVAVHWVVDRWHDLIDAFNATVAFFQRVGSAIGDAISGGIRGAINWVIGVVNGFLHGINWVIDGLNHLPGVNIGHIPDIPRLHTGGQVGGASGSEQLRVLQAGETVFPADKPLPSGGGATATVRVAGDVDSGFATWFQNMVRTGVITIEVT